MFKKGMQLMVLLIMVLAVPGKVFAETNLLENGGFEQADANQPASWLADVWNNGDEYSRLMLQQDVVHSGSNAALIENIQDNDAKYIQKVAVLPNTTYRLSAYLLVDWAKENAKGANVSILGIGDTSLDLKTTEGGWQLVEMYGKTGKNQKELQVAVRLGGYGSLTQGKAYFDDVVFEKVDSAPAGTTVYNFTENPEIPDAVSAMSIAAFSALFVLLCFFVTQRWLRRKEEPRLYGHYKLLFLVAAALAIGVRIFIGLRNEGYVTDMNTFKAWAHKAANGGLGSFYSEGFADYPPGYIYVLWLLGKLQAAFQLVWDSKAAGLLIKLPAIITDVAISALLFRVGAKRLGAAAGFGLSLIFLFNPAVIINSAGWGQVDSFFTFFLLVALLLLHKGKWEWSAVVFGLTILIKPQALIFTPVFLYPLIQRKEWRRLGISLVSGLGVIVMFILPFSLGPGQFSIIELYSSTLAQYNYASLNAFNLFSLIGANFVDVKQGFGSLSYQMIGNIFIVLTVALTAYLYLRRKHEGGEKIFFTAFLLIMMVFTLSAKMHERYLFPALALLLAAYIFSRDKRILHLFTGVSIAHYFNVHYVLKSSQISQPFIAVHDGILLLVSFVQVALFIWAIAIGYDLMVKKRTVPLETHKEYKELPERPLEEGLLHDPNSGAKMDKFVRKDWIGMGAVTLIYAVVALYNLGSFHSPQTTWEPAYQTEAVVDLGEIRTLSQVNTFGEIGTGLFKLEFSETEGDWANEVTIENTYTKIFWWNIQELDVKARYVKISVVNSGFALNEMAFYEAGETTPVPASILSESTDHPPKRGTADYLFDEQENAVYNPTFMNQTYFDEIYHARTAYEHLHMMKPYETTHPPLGKLIMSVGIWLFGLNPFGWRIAGTLVGILMVPLTYVFARRLFGRSEYALLASFLMAVDFMHYVQTRIATIDSYGVFFIMLMYYYMYRYYSMNFYKEPFAKTLRPLFLSGLFFGIGAASKWIVIYGGAGLALIFFLSLYERYQQWRAAGKLLKLQETLDQPQLQSELRHIRKSFGRLTTKSVAWCSLFFVIIPILIYSLSFLPIMSVPGEEKSVAQLIEYQEDMFDYHSKLKATHGFGSPWYEWPLMGRPMWFYSGKEAVEPDQVSSIWTFGNPAIWWVGLAAFVASLILLKRNRHRGMFVVAVAFFSQYLPWVLVTRLTFIYHYFAMVPFLIFSIVYMCKYLVEKNRSLRILVIGYAVVSLLLFILFFPVLSGLTVPKWYVDTFLQWFDSWYFYTN